jgi:hypothetical protein
VVPESVDSVVPVELELSEREARPGMLARCTVGNSGRLKAGIICSKAAGRKGYWKIWRVMSSRMRSNFGTPGAFLVRAALKKA